MAYREILGAMSPELSLLSYHCQKEVSITWVKQCIRYLENNIGQYCSNTLTHLELFMRISDEASICLGSFLKRLDISEDTKNIFFLIQVPHVN
jgi:hypothetical protein